MARFFRVMLSKDVRESPFPNTLQGSSRLRVEVHVIFQSFRVVNVDGFGGDVEVTHP